MLRTEARYSLRELVGSVAGDVGELVRGEIAMTRAEAEQKINRLLAAVIALIGAMLLAYAGLVVALIAGAMALTRVVPDWAAYLIVGGVVLVIGLALALAARSALSARAMVPDRTLRNLKADTRVVKEHVA